MSGTGSSGRQYVLVMRHGLRQDEVDSLWVQQAERPWDPPLAYSGRAQVDEAAQLIQAYGIEKVVSSPFIRCLQTASCICKTLRPPIREVEIDNALCEILGPTYFAGGGGPAEGQSVQDWLWAGLDPEAAWAAGLASDELIAKSAGTLFPEVPETVPEAHVRYTHAIEAAANRAGSKNVLIVTHGEAVGKSVTRLLPWVTVYSVQHCGFTVAWREIDEDGDLGLWNLEDEQPDEQKGVFWRSKAAAV